MYALPILSSYRQCVLGMFPNPMVSGIIFSKVVQQILLEKVHINK